MTPQTFIFIGRSGCGKGTQAKILDEYIKKQDPGISLFHLETGQKFRDFIANSGYTNDLAREIMKLGKRQPDFLAVWMWSHIFIDNLKGNEHIIIDGTPRSLHEAEILDNALKFYNRQKPFIIHLAVSRAWSEKHLLARGRSDDVTNDIKQRLDWYEQDVVPAVEYYRTNPDYTFVEVQGEQTIEAVSQELLKKIQI